MIEEPIILLDDGEGGLAPPAHLPALRSGRNNRFPNLDTAWAPERWPALCGAGVGLVYIRDGSFANIEACIDCAVAHAVAA